MPRIDSTSMNTLAKILRVWVASLCFSLPAFAHQTGNSYLTITESQGQLHIELDFLVRDLGNLLQNPKLSDAPAPAFLPTPSPEQLQAMQPAITQVIQESLGVQLNQQTQALAFVSQSVVLRNDGL